MAETIVFRGTPQEAKELVRQIPAMLAGRISDAYGLARGIQLRCGVALLSQVQQDFITKSRGGTGRDGIKWKPLDPRTIAQRRTTPQERRAAGVGGRRVRGLLTQEQDRAWRQRFARVYAWARVDMDDKEARAFAAASAWKYVKEQLGAKTKLEVFGHRQVDILRDTGELLRSLTPGVEDNPSGADGQVFETPPGRVIVGTNKKPWHQDGIPGKLPARPMWPQDGKIPAAWWPAVTRAAARGYQLAVRHLLGAR